MNTFERREVKFIVPKDELSNIVEVIKEHVNGFDQKYTVCNVYYDTDDYVLIRRSIDKPLYKEKLRVRSYGVPESNDDIFVELKKKYNRIVYKRRLRMDADDFDYSINHMSGSQIANEIAYMSTAYAGIEPKIYLSYDRVAFNDDEIRISFDDNITYREYDLDLQKGVYGDHLLENAVVMEVKINGAMPLWLADKTIYVETLTTEHVNRVQKSFKDPAGRGINVSRVLNSLGINNQLLTLLAGEKGKFIVDELSKKHDLIYKEIEGNTRENIKVINQINHDVYSINETGPNVTKQDVCDLLNNVSIKENDIVVLSGSAPNGISCHDYKEFLDGIIEKKAFVFLDTSGDMLAEGIKSNPNVIKPNKDELEHLMGRTYESAEEVAADAENILKLGVDRVLVTLGKDGSVYISPRNVYIVEGISVDALSNVGSGGAYLSGFVYGLNKGMTTVESLKWAAAASVASVTTVSTSPAELRRVEEFVNRVKIKEVFN